MQSLLILNTTKVSFLIDLWNQTQLNLCWWYQIYAVLFLYKKYRLPANQDKQ